MYNKRKDKSKISDIVSLANFSISTMRNMIWFLVLFITIVVSIFTYFGYNKIESISDAEESINKKVQQINSRIEEINKQKLLISSKMDTIDFVLSKIMIVDKNISSIQDKYGDYEEQLKSNKELTISLDDKIRSINEELEYLSDIFNKVAATHQLFLTSREKLILYLLASTIDNRKPLEQQNVTIKANLGLMWKNIGAIGMAYRQFKDIEGRKDELEDWPRENFEKNLTFCENIINKIKSDTLDTNEEAADSLEVLDLPTIIPKLAEILIKRGYLIYEDLELINKMPLIKIPNMDIEIK